MKNGFTLLELLIVIAIIGILASVILIGYEGYTDKARLANTLQWAGSVSHSLGFNAVGVWTFDNISGSTVYDDSGNNNNGTISGAVQVDGIVGKALSFNGTSNYIRIPATSLYNKTNTITITAWVKTSSASAQTILQQGNNCNVHPTPWFYYSGSVMGVRSSVADPSYYIPSGTATINDNKFHFLVVSLTNGQAPKFYFDGKDVTASSAKWYVNSALTNWDVLIGAAVTGPCGSTNPNTQFVNGILDDVRIFKEAYTQAQIQQLYVDDLREHQSLAAQH